MILHTPGPWRLTDEPVRRVVKGGKPERSIVIVEEWTREEDARLIVAAPEMYDALRLAAKYLDGECAALDGDEVLTLIRLLLAKAEGRLS